MRWYKQIRTTFVSREKIVKAYDFAKAVVQTVNYSDSNQRHQEKIKDDHFVSKIGEEAVVNVLRDYGSVTGPDYTIYKGKDKSWLHDLEMNGTAIAVKTQRRTAARHYGLSWTFQNASRRRDSLLYQPDAWIVFVEYNDENPYECFVYPPYQLKELTFEEPKLAHLKDTKKVVYAATLPSL